jgi:drug/metabolite transporter (DMT)-like permease
MGPELRASRALQAHLALWAVALIYAANYFLAKELFKALPPLAMAALRSLLSLPLLYALWLRYGRERPRGQADWLLLALCAFCGASLNQVLFFWGLSLTQPVNAAVLMTTSPLFVFLWAWASGSERSSALRIGGLLMAFGGALLLAAGSQRLALGGSTLAGDLMILVNAASYGLYLVLVRPLLARYRTLSIIFWLSLLGALGNVAAGLPQLVTLDWSRVSWDHAAIIAYIVLFVTVATYVLNGWSLKVLPSSVVGVYIYLQPVLVLLLTLTLFREPLPLWKLGAAALVMGGVAAVSYRKKRSPDRK